MSKSKIFDLQTFTHYACEHTASECARLYSLSYSALFHRLSIGWSLDKALNTKVGYRCQK